MDYVSIIQSKGELGQVEYYGCNRKFQPSHCALLSLSNAFSPPPNKASYTLALAAFLVARLTFRLCCNPLLIARRARIAVISSRCCAVLPLSDAFAAIPNTARRMLRVNFDPLIVRLLREVKYFLLLGLKVPDSALEVFSRGEVRRQLVRRVLRRSTLPRGAGAEEVEEVHGVPVHVVHAEVHHGVKISDGVRNWVKKVSKFKVRCLLSPSRTV